MKIITFSLIKWVTELDKCGSNVKYDHEMAQEYHYSCLSKVKYL